MPMPATPEVSTQDPVTQAQLRQPRQHPPHMPVTVPTLSDIEATARRTVDHDAGLPSRMQTKTPPSPHTNHSCSPRSAESLTGAQRVGFNQKVEQETCAHWPDLQIDRKGYQKVLCVCMLQRSPTSIDFWLGAAVSGSDRPSDSSAESSRRRDGSGSG
jgi:hypothetical protein